ncbi:hypothetical protein JO972_08720 [Verrucomicrobiaceae bacterium 5K15]|uniref:Sialate O-acetylesterase domain-containing protein n=1 Tax=Oceaniferula flava TaxID=2800421 RepID=A0AAE2SDT0_9BACT|nr:sialate O-acetylesterase [Oceaniferula flavus]MBK1855039.1 hypothetical protein [Oceaniferula flavus]MBM1136345.1 hypothetical protein [Oceaniferula flavus]
MKSTIITRTKRLSTVAAIVITAAVTQNGTCAETTGIQAPDDQPADMRKPVQVFILLGQSNMVGMGKVKGKKGSLEHAVKIDKKYPYLQGSQGQWTERKDVRYVRVMGSGMNKNRKLNNEWLTVKGNKIGPEIGIGHRMGQAIDAPVMILKSCIGNRSLGWDLLAPGSPRYEFEEKVKDGTVKTYIYAKYKESPMKWEKGTDPKPINWYAGVQYDGDISRAKAVLADLDAHYPGANGYEVAGFFFWQGDKDRYDAGLSANYENNLVHLIKQLRKEFDAPIAKFVCATLGQTEKGAKGNEGLILEAQLAVDGETGKYQAFKGNVATVYSHPLSLGGSSNGHYDGNAETYMNIGEAMGQAMTKLLKISK